MTPRKLTPAEALECLRDWRSTTMSLMDHRRKWGQLELDGLFRIAIAALEEALAQKPPAADAPIIDIEPGTFVVVSPGALRFTERVIVRRFDEDKLAAPVPSDEEIVAQLGYVMASQGELVEVYGALRLLARRIGVQGVPK